MPFYRVAYQVTVNGSIDVEADDREAAAIKVEDSDPSGGWELLMPDNDTNDVTDVDVSDVRELKEDEVRKTCWRKPKRPERKR